jgi:flagellin-like hook-associated protein FlgL
MSFTISNNTAAASSNYYLGKNQDFLQTSIKRLASGKKLIRPSDDPGGLSVAMKLKASVSRLTGARNNVQNGTSFLEVQDGVLEGAGRIVTRMAELKGLGAQDPMKSSQDVESYNLEFRDLQRQLYDMSQMTFNGVSLFANTGNTGDQSVFRDVGDATNNTVSIQTSTQGSSGSKVSLHKAKFLAAITLEVGDLDRSGNTTNAIFDPTTVAGKVVGGITAGDRYTNSSAGIDKPNTGQFISFASEDSANVWDLDAVSIGFFQQALENIAFLRARVGGQMSRLSFAADNLSVQQTNIRAALGRIEDVDIASESSNLSKYSILTQAAASMLTQANSTNDVALMLIR